MFIGMISVKLSFSGDNDTDIQAAINSGCKYFKINSNHELPQIVKKILDQDIGDK